MEKSKLSKSRGGARPGAGRKKMDSSSKKETVGLRLRPDLKERIFHVAEERGISVSELIAQLIESSLQ